LNIDFRDNNFVEKMKNHVNKNVSLAPEGYRYLYNIPKTELDNMKILSSGKYIINPIAYNIWDEISENYVAVFEKIN